MALLALNTTDDPNIAEQLRVWAVEWADKADTAERPGAKPLAWEIKGKFPPQIGGFAKTGGGGQQ